jgi:hypothetical protein
MAASVEKAESQRMRVRERMMELQAQLAATQVCGITPFSCGRDDSCGKGDIS